MVNGVTAKLVKHGLYLFNADHPDVSVYDGEAMVSQGDKQVKVKKGRQLALAIRQSGFRTSTASHRTNAPAVLRTALRGGGEFHDGFGGGRR